MWYVYCKRVFPVTWKGMAGEAVPTSWWRCYEFSSLALCSLGVIGLFSSGNKGAWEHGKSHWLKALTSGFKSDCVTNLLCDLSGLVALSENERSVSPGCQMKWVCKFHVAHCCAVHLRVLSYRCLSWELDGRQWLELGGMASFYPGC